MPLLKVRSLSIDELEQSINSAENTFSESANPKSSLLTKNTNN